MQDDVAQILVDLGGELLPQNDARRPVRLRKLTDLVALLPTSSSRFPKLVVHLPDTFPWKTPDVYVPGDVQLEMTPHVNGHLVCSRGYKVFANPGRRKEVLQRVITEALTVLEQPLTDEQKREHFLSEAQAYWVTEDTTRFHYLPSLIDHTFVFQCKETKIHIVTVLEAQPLGTQPEIVGLRIDVPAEEICGFLVSTEKWFAQNASANDVLRRGLEALNKLSHRPKMLKMMLAFRVRAANGDFILSARIVQEIKLLKLLGRHPNFWLERFHEQAQELRKISSEDLSTRRLIRRSIGKSASQSSAFTAIEETRLAVIGCGSLGSHIIDLLLQSGMQNMYLVDNELLFPENLARHGLPGIYQYIPKAEGLRDKALRSYPEANITLSLADIRLPDAQKHLVAWSSSLVVCAAADQSAEMLLSELARNGSLPGVWYCWVEPHLTAGHLVFQPAGQESTLADLYTPTEGDWFYCHRVSRDDSADTERECGCQTTFTPFSGADSALFSAMCARKILEYIESPPTKLTAFRWIPQAGGLEMLL
jgi:hypothetical protein